MSKTTSVALRLDTDLKEQASAIVEALGMDLTTAIRLYLTQLVFRKGIPFPVALGKERVFRMRRLLRRLSGRRIILSRGRK